jgi:N,N'-diacetylchitobiose phosphorylase
MQYGYFDDKNREYVIDRPDTPESWSNYLGSTKYGAVITNNAGGYSFFNSAADGRFMRLRPNTIPMDQPGRYFYVHDRDSKDFWSASWQPVGKPLDQYKTVCRHGTAYTIITSEYNKIQTETCYFVPLGELFECWNIKIKNKDSKKRSLRFFTYAEFTGHWQLWLDIVNLQYTQYIMAMDVIDGIIDHGTNANLPFDPDDLEHGGQGRHIFMGVAGAKPSGYDTDRKKFIGPYRSYHNPIAVEIGQCSQSKATSDNGCGTQQIDIILEAGEEKEFTIVMGFGFASVQGKKAVAEYSKPGKVSEEFTKLKNHWHHRLEGMTAVTPDAELNSMFNMWSPYNCLITYAWSRAASLVYNGERNGLGYRDTVQDILGVLHSIPGEAIERLELMLTGQYSNGGAMPVVKPFSHSPGKEIQVSEEEFRSDDCMWLFNTVPAYVKETGDLSFYNKVLPYADNGEDTVLGHLRKAMEFNLARMGQHNLPCGLSADWNDCLQLGHNGETVFVAFQLRYALVTYIEIGTLLKKQAEIDWASPILNKLDESIEKHAWDGDWYMRAYRWDGMKFGAKDCEEGSIWLNPQTWSIISGHATGDKAKHILKNVKSRLSTDYGLMICDPPYQKADVEVIKASLFNKGTKENGGIFCHIQGWAVMAEAMLGNGTQAYQYFRAFLPSAYNTKAEIREIEPYVYSQSTHSKYSPRYGASRLPWLTGAATWAFYSLSQYILGIRPEYNGITIDPCIPSSWDEIKITRRFRGKTIDLLIKNPERKEKGILQLEVNGKTIQGNFIPIDLLSDKNTVVAVL